jgi:hypothetical protein
MDDRKEKRCKARNPRTLARCIKPRAHLNDLDVVHQNGVLIWRDALKVEYGTGFPSRVLSGGTVKSIKFEGRDVTAFVDTTKLIGFETSADEHHTEFQAEPEGSDELAENPPISPEDELKAWWVELAGKEADAVVPKAIEYSSTDLTDIGHDLARTMGREVSDEEAAELGVFFYLRGKVARWVGAVINGARVSDDTLHDIGVYVRMAQRIREKGNWPGVDLT